MTSEAPTFESPASAARDGRPVGALAAVVVMTVLHLVVAARAPLVSDEAYYWLWSQHLSAGYYDHPPMVAFWIAAGTRLLGDTELAVRLLTVLTLALVSLVIYATARAMFVEAATASRAVIWFNAMLLVGAGGFIVSPDAPSILFWSLVILCLARLMRSDDGRWWLAVGLFAGLGVVSKYTNLFLGLGILLWLVADARARRWLTSPWLWAGGLTASLVVAPVVAWNALHDWASFARQFGRIGASGDGATHLLEFIGAQLVFVGPLAAIFVIAAPVVWLRKRTSARRCEVGMLVATVAPFLAYMVVHSIHQRVEGNWLAPVYPTFALLAAFAASVLASRAWRVVRGLVAPVGLALSVACLFIIGWPVDSVLSKNASPSFVGWRDLAAAVDTVRVEQGATWIATTNYAVNAELAFYLRRAGAPVAQINDRNRYDFAPAADPPDGPAILVSRSGSADRYAACFATLTPISVVKRTGGSERDRFGLYRAEDPVAGILSSGCPRARTKEPDCAKASSPSSCSE